MTIHLKNMSIIKSGIDFKKPVLAFGAELKNTFCLARKKHILISQDYGNLENLDNYLKYEKDLQSLLKRLRIRPDIVTYDLHPEYLSTKLALNFAKQNNINKTIAVQHHHAHIASTAFLNNIKGEVIGVAFDGTGYGTDGHIWGGEFIVADLVKFKRAAHLKYIPMPGGNLAVMEPWRMALSWLYSINNNNIFKLYPEFIKKLDKKKIKIIIQMLEKNVNSPLTSSMGRLFDAVSSLITDIKTIKFEAQGPIVLEEMAFSAIDARCSHYSFNIKNEECLIIDPSNIFRQIIFDIKKNISKDKIAFKFHCTVAKIIQDVCLALRKKYGLNNVVLSGGVFQNRIVSELSQDTLRKYKFNVFIHKTVPINDAGISIGQAIVANSNFKRRK